MLVIVASGCEHETTRPFVAPTPALHEDSRVAATDDLAREAGTVPHVEPDQVGQATWYGKAFAGAKTASGERFDPSAMTAAHRKLPFGTWVEVRRRDTGATVRVRITDRGPWGNPARVIDLSQAAADRLGMMSAGVVSVELRVVPGP